MIFDEQLETGECVESLYFGCKECPKCIVDIYEKEVRKEEKQIKDDFKYVYEALKLIEKEETTMEHEEQINHINDIGKIPFHNNGLVIELLNGDLIKVTIFFYFEGPQLTGVIYFNKQPIQMLGLVNLEILLVDLIKHGFLIVNY